MRQTTFPVWYRAYVIIPILAVAYFTFPLRWNFSPHSLTHTLPAFLLGATDWGSGNMYTFAKIVFWISMIIGASANAFCEHSDDMSLGKAVKWRFGQNIWHVGAALCLPLGLSLPLLWDLKFSIDLLDMWLLVGYLIVGVLAILFTVSLGQRHAWSRWARLFCAVAIGIAWGFVPVAIGRP